MLQPRGFPETRASLLATLGDDARGQSAWREFFERYAPAVYRVARLRGLNEHDADDLVQQVMLAISAHIGDFHYDRDRGRFRHWVRTIAENKIKQQGRRRQPVISDAALLENCADAAPTADEQWQREWQVQDMLWCLDEVAADISPRRMEAFRMYALEGVPAAEVAQRLGMTIGHVYVTRHLVLNRIREQMQKLQKRDER
jgi:RNA polymerase sigma factor (sigma-70 family)